MANLSPGRYPVIASVFGYPTFYPATTSADRATVIGVGADAPVQGIELAGMPGGYSLASVRLGTEDVSQGVTVGTADVTGLVITIAPPRRLPKLRGKIVGVPAANLASAKVELTGHVIGALEAPIQKDGSFEFPAITPGTYRVRLPPVPEGRPVLRGRGMGRH